MKYSAPCRNTAMDIIRCMAFLFVVSVHFFRYTDFYYLYVVGPKMYLMTIMRSTFMICVPLFIMLSGYFLNRKKPERSYFVKIQKTLSIYFLASVCCYLYAHCFAADSSGNGSLIDFLRQVLAFEAAPYAWYINMYLGLFFLIPYLNLIFQGLQGEKERRKLILILLFFTALPGILNVFSFSDGFRFIGAAHSPDPIIPDYWQIIYPITYYFLGAYLCRHPLPIKKQTSFMLLLIAVFLNGALNIVICQGDYFPLGPWQEYEALPNVIVSVLFFNYFSQVDCHRLRPWFRNLLAEISDLTLGAFLVSWIFDNIFYRILRLITSDFYRQIFFFPIVVLSIFCCSLLLSFLLDLLYSLLVIVLSKLFAKPVSNKRCPK